MAYIGQEPGQGQAERFLFTASGSETSVTTADDGRTIGYTVGQVSVYLNGVKLVVGTGKDCQAANGSTITGLSALTASDVVEVIALSAFSPSDTVSASTGGTFTGAVTLTTPNLGTPSAGVMTNMTGAVTASLVDNAVTLAKMAGGTDGQIITYDASGDPIAVGPGDDGQVLTSTGAGSPPAFEDATGGVAGIVSSADATSITIGSDENVNIDGEVTMKDCYNKGPNNSFDIGTSSVKWRDLYLHSAAFNGSDRDLKKDIVTSSLGLVFINKLNPVSYKWKDVPEILYTKDNLNDEQDEDIIGQIKSPAQIGKRTHYGLIAQDVKATLDELGIDTVDFGGYGDGKARLDEDGNKKSEDGSLCLRYTEFLPPLIKAVQELSVKNDALEIENTAMKTRMDTLEARVLALES